MADHTEGLWAGQSPRLCTRGRQAEPIPAPQDAVRVTTWTSCPGPTSCRPPCVPRGVWSFGCSPGSVDYAICELKNVAAGSSSVIPQVTSLLHVPLPKSRWEDASTVQSREDRLKGQREIHRWNSEQNANFAKPRWAEPSTYYSCHTQK